MREGMLATSRLNEGWACRYLVRALCRPAFSVVGVKEIWRTLNGWTKSTCSGQRLESHTKTLMERVSLGINYIPLPTIGEGLGEWFEAPSYEEGVGDDGSTEGSPPDMVWMNNSASMGRTSPFKKTESFCRTLQKKCYICSHYYYR